ncbi:MAG: hypothetical protein ACRDYV_20830, partial [Acidimicrobiia bacterium]
GEYAMRRLDDMRLPWAKPARPSPEVPVANAPFAAVLVHPDGGIFTFGDAVHQGNMLYGG